MTQIDIPEMKIFLNIYDLKPANNYLHHLGLGAYHTGIQFFDTEFAFGYHDGSHTGVYETEPRRSYQGKFRESIYVGTTHLGVEEVLDAIEELKVDYIGCSYNIFTKNCNHFSNDLCIKLVNKPIPCYLNRLARISFYIKCLIPKNFALTTSQAPSKSRHRKKDSIHLNSHRIRKNRGHIDMQNQSQVEKLALASHDEKNDSSVA